MTLDRTELAQWRRTLSRFERALTWSGGPIVDVAGYVQKMKTRVTPPEELDEVARRKAFVLQLAGRYRLSNEEDRREIRALFDDYPAVAEVLVSVAESLAREIDGPEDGELLAQAYALISMNDQRGDWRELVLALGELNLRGRDRGAPVSEKLMEAAALSSDQVPAHRRSSSRELLEQEAKMFASRLAVRDELVRALSDIAQLLRECGWDERAAWVSARRNEFASIDPESGAFRERLRDFDSILVGMGSLSDMPMYPKVGSSLTVRRARQAQWDLVNLIGSLVRALLKRK